MTGAYEESVTWILGYGTKLVWNSVMLNLKAPSNTKGAVKEETVWQINLFNLL
jgi:hypothetical protein